MTTDARDEELRAAHARIAELENRGAPVSEALLRLVAHELRSPLAPMLTAVQLLEEDPALPNEFRRWLAVIRRNALVEAWMVDDVMDLLRIRGGVAPHPPERAGLHEILRAAVEAASGELAHKRVELTQSLEATQTDLQVQPSRATHGIWNLLRAAMKSTSGSGPFALHTRDGAGGAIVEILQPPGTSALAPGLIAGYQGDDAALIALGAVGLAALLARDLLGSMGVTLSARIEGASLVHSATFPRR